MRVLYEASVCGVTVSDITDISWLDGYVTFRKVTGEQVRIYFGDLADFELMITVDKVYDLRNRAKEQQPQHEQPIVGELPKTPIPNVITVHGDDDALPDKQLRDVWKKTDELRKGYIYNTLPGVYRCLVCDEYVRSDLATYALSAIKRFTFDKTTYDFQGLYAVASTTLHTIMKQNFRYFWDLCRDGLNTKINATFTEDQIISFLKAAYEEEKLCSEFIKA